MATSPAGPAGAGDAVWTLRLLGGLVRLERGDEALRLEPRTAVLLALLALEGPLLRERAAALLWPDRPPDRARANLRQLLYRLRQRADVVTGDPLALRPGVVLDVAAIDLRNPLPEEGSLLHGYDVQDLGEIAERFAAARARLVSRVRTELLAQAEAAASAGDRSIAALAATRLAELEPANEAAVQTAMRSLLALGEPSRALHLFARTKDALERLLDLTPGDDTVELARRAAAASAQPLGSKPSPFLAEPPSRQGGPPGHAPSAHAPAGQSDRWVRRAEARGWLAEGASLLRAQAATHPPGPERARLLAQTAWLDHQAGDHHSAEEAAYAALGDLDEQDDDPARIEAWFVLGSIARQRGDLRAARQWWDRALERAARRTDGADTLTLRLNLGLVADALGSAEEALDHYLAALPLAQAQADEATLTLLLNNVGHVLLGWERIEDARRLLIRAADIAAASGDRRLRAYALEGLARCATASGDATTARALAADALATANEIGDPVLRVEAALSVATADALVGARDRALATARAALGVARRHANQPGALRAAAVIAELVTPG